MSNLANNGAVSHVAVTTASTSIVAAAARAYLLVYNNGSALVWLAFGATAVAGAGIPLAAGAAFEAPAELRGLALNGISTSGTQNVSYQTGTFTSVAP